MKNKYINKSAIALVSIFIMLLSFMPNAKAQSFSEGFDDLSLLTD